MLALQLHWYYRLNYCVRAPRPFFSAIYALKYLRLLN